MLTPLEIIINVISRTLIVSHDFRYWSDIDIELYLLMWCLVGPTNIN